MTHSSNGQNFQNIQTINGESMVKKLNAPLHKDSHDCNWKVSQKQGGGVKEIDNHVTDSQLHLTGNCDPDNSNQTNICL